MRTIGSWDAVAALANEDESGNVIQGDGLLLQSTNTFIHAESRLVTEVGLKNMIVVETRDAVLVANSAQTQNIKDVVDNLKSQNRKEATEHLKIHRPWGSYESLVLGDRFHVKQTTVTPGESLSLQKHHHRAEHWVVVHGTAKIRINDAEAILTEDQSIYVPLGAKHRLSNPGKVELILIEVQSGVYLGEDDIIRYDDPYSRNIE